MALPHEARHASPLPVPGLKARAIHGEASLLIRDTGYEINSFAERNDWPSENCRLGVEMRQALKTNAVRGAPMASRVRLRY